MLRRLGSSSWQGLEAILKRMWLLLRLYMQVVFWFAVMVCLLSDEGVLLVRRRFMSFKDFWCWELAGLYFYFVDLVMSFSFEALV